MRITFTQSGGFVGAVRSCAVDTATLADADRREVEALVAASGLVVPLELFSAGGRDRRQYEITIEKGSAPLRIACDDASLPAAARPLVAFLSARARPVPSDPGADAP
jgi:hypothetical protein